MGLSNISIYLYCNQWLYIHSQLLKMCHFICKIIQTPSPFVVSLAAPAFYTEWRRKDNPALKEENNKFFIQPSQIQLTFHNN